MVSVETVRCAKDGRAIPVLLNAAPVLDAAGRLVLIATTLTDLTARKQAEEQLQAATDRLRRLIDVETVGIIFFHVDGRITGCNPAFLRLSGYTQADLDHGRLRWDRMTPPEYLPQSRQAIAEFRAHGRIAPYEKEYLRKDGSRWWGVVAAMRLDADTGVEFIIDITERKRAEAALQANAEHLRLVVEQLPAIVWTTDRELRFTSVAGLAWHSWGCVPTPSWDTPSARSRRPRSRPFPNWWRTAVPWPGSASAVRRRGTAGSISSLSSRSSMRRARAWAASAWRWTSPSSRWRRRRWPAPSAGWPRYRRANGCTWRASCTIAVSSS